MKKLLMACALCAAGVALAAGETKADAKTGTTPAPATGTMTTGTDAKAGDMKAGGDPMGMWKPKKVTKKDDKAIETACKSMGDAMMKGDLEAATAYIDFPVLMVTDNAAGNASSTTMTKEQWIATMKPSVEGMAKMGKDMKMSEKRKNEWISDSLVVSKADHTMTMGKTKMEYSSAELLILKDGKWLSKAMVEGGWGDVMGAKGASVQTGATDTKAAMK